jgi:phosphoserine aminotransferase
MLAVEDYLDALAWAKKVGGLDGLVKRADANFRVIAKFVRENDWIDFLAVKPKTRSNTSVCLKFTDPAVTALAPEAQAVFAKQVVSIIEKAGAGYDLGHYRDAPPGLRIWCGATVQARDLKALLPWIEYAFAEAKAGLGKKAA